MTKISHDQWTGQLKKAMAGTEIEGLVSAHSGSMIPKDVATERFWYTRL
jgi:hypothetical protein